MLLEHLGADRLLQHVPQLSDLVAELRLQHTARHLDDRLAVLYLLHFHNILDLLGRLADLRRTLHLDALLEGFRVNVLYHLD